MALVTHRFFYFLVLSLVLSAPLLFQAHYCFAETVSARLYQENNSGAVIEIHLSSPAPTNLIVQLYLPEMNHIVDTSPPPVKINQENGSIKWLLKDTRPGPIYVRLTTSKSFDLAKATAFIRFRRPDKGDLVEIEAQKN